MSRCSFNSRVKFKREPCRGLTLLELIVVLAILGLMTTVAVRSLDPIANQSRYDATRNTLNDLRMATVGDSTSRLADGQRLISGYIADTGLLPSATEDLSVMPIALIAYALQSFDSDRDSVNDVSLSSGWNGPYFHLGIGQEELNDGWGNAFDTSEASGTLEFRSLGSDGDSIAPEDGYQKDLIVSIAPQEYRATLVLRPFAIDDLSGARIDPSDPWLASLGPFVGTRRLGVLYYGANANGGTTGAIQEKLVVVPSSGTFEYRQLATHGQVAVRAIAWDDANNDSLLNIGETIYKKSYVHHLNIVAGPDIRIEFELR